MLMCRGFCLKKVAQQVQMYCNMLYLVYVASHQYRCIILLYCTAVHNRSSRPRALTGSLGWLKGWYACSVQV